MVASGNTVIVGAPGWPGISNHSGAVYVFRTVPGDINGDTIVDVADLALAGAQWGTDGSGHPFGWNADVAPLLGGDGTVDIGDLAVVGFNWTGGGGGSSLGGGATVPAPGAGMAGLALLGGICSMRRRRAT